jgi:hypothetical protein
MSHVECPECRYKVGLGTCSEPGTCPNCGTTLMLTAEMRALTREDILAEARRRADGGADLDQIRRAS